MAPFTADMTRLIQPDILLPKLKSIFARYQQAIAKNKLTPIILS